MSDHFTNLEEVTLAREGFKHTRERHQHFVWWVDSGIRVALTGWAAILTWNWLEFIQDLVGDLATKEVALTDSVAIAVLTTTTANVLGMWAVVAAYVWYVPNRIKRAFASKGDLAPDTDDDEPG